MEKIYMEENQQKKRQNHRLGFSVGLSFFVAIFAMFSLLSFGLAVYGNNGGVSYAAPITTDSFTLTNDYVIVDPINAEARVPLLFNNHDTNSPVFCVQHGAQQIDVGKKHDKHPAAVDYGLLYLLNHSYANGVSVTGYTGSNANLVESWVTQVAIWIYLNEKNPSDEKHAVSASMLAAWKAATSLATFDGTNHLIYTYTPTADAPTIYDAYIKPLVAAAKTATSARQLLVSIDSENPATISSDKSFYQSPKVTVSGEQLINFDVTVSGVDGAYLVDENGTEMSATGITPGKEFYVRIPSDKVGTETIDVTVNAKGHFNTLKGEYFLSSESGEDAQMVVTVTGDTTDVSTGTSFQIIPTPPTGMNAAQTIYFIGLIVLLCGVGIVYANAKPVESKQ